MDMRTVSWQRDMEKTTIGMENIVKDQDVFVLIVFFLRK